MERFAGYAPYGIAPVFFEIEAPAGSLYNRHGIGFEAALPKRPIADHESAYSGSRGGFGFLKAAK